MNAVGGQDELVFDGGSLVVSPDGEVIARASMFEEDLLVVEDRRCHGIGSPEPSTRPGRPGPRRCTGRSCWGSATTCGKNGFREVVIGLSGGIDSALVATLAVDALGPDAVRVLAMPSPYSSPESVEDAVDCAQRLGARIDTVPITDVFDAYRRTLTELFTGTEDGVAEENMQARIRGNLLMALSNKFGSLVLATGNKSEYAVGYATLYGDMAGGFAPIKDVPKTLVYELSRLAQRAGSREGPDPRSDHDETPVGRAASRSARHGFAPALRRSRIRSSRPTSRTIWTWTTIVARGGFDRATVERVTRMIDRAEYKRRQAAPGVKITPKAFGRDRRLPITNRYGAP